MLLDTRVVALDASNAGLYTDVSHYLDEVDPSPLPPARAGLAATKLATAPAHLLLAIIATCAMPERLRVADEAFCSSAHHTGIECHAYVDCAETGLINHSLINVGVVPGPAYLRPWHAPHPNCSVCDDSVDMTDVGTWSGGYVGSSSFYCAGQGRGRYATHVVATLPAQYRYLPALQHAKGAAHTYPRSAWRGTGQPPTHMPTHLCQLPATSLTYLMHPPALTSTPMRSLQPPVVPPLPRSQPLQRRHALARAARRRQLGQRAAVADGAPAARPHATPAARGLCPVSSPERDALETAVCVRRRGHGPLTSGRGRHRRR